MPDTKTSDLISLRSEREANSFPFSRPPFIRQDTDVATLGDDDDEDLLPGELRVKAPEEVPWIDILLEIAMTTAFASLTDGTPVLQWSNVISYIGFFVFVWWIWAAQVAYNMRFRQADWCHRFYSAIQLVLFSALAAFTRNFDLTTGLVSTDDEETDQLLAQFGNSESHLDAFNFRNQRLPRLNAKGLSLVMCLSRLVLFVQYVIVWYHARGLKRSSLTVHMVPLLFSAACYITVFFLMGPRGLNADGGPSTAFEIVKLVLWYFPITVEIVSHFVALHMPGFVRYSTDSVEARSAVLFIIILGGGLDKITRGFQDFVGNPGLGSHNIGLFFASASVFIFVFSLYFGTPGTKRTGGHKRSLAWFFSQFIFLSALIVTLQAVATSLQFSNLITAVNSSRDALAPLFNWMAQNPGKEFAGNLDQFSASSKLWENMGISFQDVISNANYAISSSNKFNNTDIVVGYELQQEMLLISFILTTLEADPEPGTLLWAKLGVFQGASPANTTAVNEDTFYDIWGEMIKDRGSSTLWLFPSAGCLIFGLVILSLIKGLPRDRWEWAVIACRIVTASGLVLLTLMDIGSSAEPLTNDGTPGGSTIWAISLSSTQWPLIILGFVMAVLRFCEYVIAHFAHKPYHSFDRLDFWQGAVVHLHSHRHKKKDERPKLANVGRFGHRRTDSDIDDQDILLTSYSYTDEKPTSSPGLGRDALYDPYDPYGEVESPMPMRSVSRNTRRTASPTEQA